MMLFRKASAEDAGEIMSVIEDAQSFMRASGLPQWQDGYPTREIIDADILRGESYVLEENGIILGTCVVTLEPDPSYATLCAGAWLSEDEPYAAVHRVAVSGKARGKGVGKLLFVNAEETARVSGVTNMRGDTHRDNKPMQRLLEASGFERCGEIMLTDSVEKDKHRVVYQKIIGTER